MAEAFLRVCRIPWNCKAMVSISADDGYKSDLKFEYLCRMNNLRATFFFLPKSIGSPGFLSANDILGLEKSPGFELANHGLTHRLFSTLDDTRILQELKTSGRLFHKIVGRQPQGFAFPHGVTSSTGILELQKLGYIYGRTTIQQGVSVEYPIRDLIPLQISGSLNRINNPFSINRKGQFHWPPFMINLAKRKGGWARFITHSRVGKKYPGLEPDVRSILVRIGCDKELYPTTYLGAISYASSYRNTQLIQDHGGSFLIKVPTSPISNTQQIMLEVHPDFHPESNGRILPSIVQNSHRFFVLSPGHHEVKLRKNNNLNIDSITTPNVSISSSHLEIIKPESMDVAIYISEISESGQFKIYGPHRCHPGNTQESINLLNIFSLKKNGVIWLSMQDKFSSYKTRIQLE